MKRLFSLPTSGAAALLVAASLVSITPAVAVPAQQDQVTAQQQSNQKGDLEITRNIRRAIIKNKSLSVAAHNVKIITRNGKVTLRGRVNSDAEKQTVESSAVSVAGQGNVDDQLTTAQ